MSLVRAELVFVTADRGWGAVDVDSDHRDDTQPRTAQLRGSRSA